MTMEVIDSGRDGEEEYPREKKMYEMVYGEVCCVVGTDRYVIRTTGNYANDQIFLILGSCPVNRYTGKCDATVRELYKDESVTIKFS